MTRKKHGVSAQSSNVPDKAYHLELDRYIVLNPERADMVQLVDDWPWSSYGVTAGKHKAPDWIDAEWL